MSIKCLLDAFDKVVEETGKIDKKMLEIAYHDREIQRFMTIPGVGPVTALTYKAEIFDAARSKESRSVGAYLGMTPTQYASGETQRQGKTSKCGSKELRFLLVEARDSDLNSKQEMESTESVGAEDYEKKRA